MQWGNERTLYPYMWLFTGNPLSPDHVNGNVGKPYLTPVMNSPGFQHLSFPDPNT